MRKYIPKSISFDPEIFDKMEKRLNSLRPRINRSQYIEKLILDDMRKVDSTGDTSIIAEQAANYVVKNGTQVVSHNHAPPNCAAKKKGRKK